MDPLDFMSPSSIVDKGYSQIILQFELWLSHPPIKFNMAKLRNCQRWERLHEKKTPSDAMKFGSMAFCGLANCTPRGKMPVSRPINSLALAFLELLFLGLHKLVVSIQYWYYICYPEMTMVETGSEKPVFQIPSQILRSYIVGHWLIMNT